MACCPCISAVPSLSAETRGLLKESWGRTKGQWEKMGAAVFLELFKRDPTMQKMFSRFKDTPVENLREDPYFVSHVLRVSALIGKCIQRIDDPKAILQLARENGAQHYKFDIEVDQLKLAGVLFVDQIKALNKKQWTEKHQRAWDEFFELFNAYTVQEMKAMGYVPKKKDDEAFDIYDSMQKTGGKL